MIPGIGEICNINVFKRTKLARKPDLADSVDPHTHTGTQTHTWAYTHNKSFAAAFALLIL